jgi:hypothetical protein
MGGQGCYKHVREIGGRMLWDECRKRSLSALRIVLLFFVEIVAVCVEVRACRNL